MSAEIRNIRSAEFVPRDEGNTNRAEWCGAAGSAASENPGTCRSLEPGPGRPLRCRDAKRRGRQSQGSSRAADARRGGVGLTHSSEEAGEQSAGSRAAESVERRGWRDGSVWQTKHGPDTEPGEAPGASGPPTDRPWHRRLRTTAGPQGCRHNRSEEPDALARTSGSVRGAPGNRRPTATRRVTGVLPRP